MHPGILVKTDHISEKLRLRQPVLERPTVFRNRDTLRFHLRYLPLLALQLPFLKVSESMGNHDSKIVDAGSVD